MNLNREINLNKKFIIILVLVNIVAISLYYSYALFQVNVIKDNVVVIESAQGLPTITTTIDNTNSNSFTLAANDTKNVTINLTANSVNNVAITSAIAYKMFYDVTGNGTFTITSTENFAENIVEGSFTGTKTLSLTFKNNSNNVLTISLGAISGLEKNGANLTNQNALMVNTSLPVGQTSIKTLNEMCPNCEFMYTTSTYNYGTSGTTREEVSETLYTSEKINDLVKDSEHSYFLGVVFDGSNSSSKIIESYVCGIEPNSKLPFCIRGYKDYTYQSQNMNFITPVFGEENCDSSSCSSASGSFNAYSSDYVSVSQDNGSCSVYGDGSLSCN